MLERTEKKEFYNLEEERKRIIKELSLKQRMTEYFGKIVDEIKEIAYNDDVYDIESSYITDIILTKNESCGVNVGSHKITMFDTSRIRGFKKCWVIDEYYIEEFHNFIKKLQDVGYKVEPEENPKDVLEGYIIYF